MIVLIFGLFFCSVSSFAGLGCISLFRSIGFFAICKAFVRSLKFLGS